MVSPLLQIDFSAFHPGAIEVKGIAGDHVGLGDYVHPAAHTKPVLHVHDREKVAKKIAQLVKDGISKLQVHISDRNSKEEYAHLNFISTHLLQ